MHNGKLQNGKLHNGMLTVYKEAGYTSSDAVARLRGILRMRKIGHTGTLDPDAEGVLPMCLGNATRICELIADREKEYLAVMRLGVRTDTQDMSGSVLSRMEDSEILTSEEEIRAAAAQFVGEIDQIPPMYSAVKINGKRLYDLARKGKTVERQARRITIHSLEIEKIELPLVTMRVRCSKGTYIRTLCEDIGNALGTGAAMQSLLRTRVGRFTLEEARTLDEIERIAKTEPEEALQALIQPVDSFFADLPAASCSGEALRLLKNGNPLGEKELHFLFGKEDPQTPPEEITGTSLPAHDDKTAGTPLPDYEDTVAPLLPGAGPEDSVIRVYDENGQFYGLYRRAKGRKQYSAFKMFLPEDK